MKLWKQHSWHSELALRTHDNSIVVATYNVGCVAQKKQEAGYLWTEHNFLYVSQVLRTLPSPGERVTA